VVPATVVQRGPQGAFAYIVGADKTAAVRPVEVESAQGDVVVIARGLQAGDQVVVEGQNQLRPGAKVSPRSQDKPAAPSSASARPRNAP
jgi:membrane fusion protein, multidrug efflux system